MRLMYVFDCRETTGFRFRAPRVVCWLFCRFNHDYDYADTPDGDWIGW